MCEAGYVSYAACACHVNLCIAKLVEKYTVVDLRVCGEPLDRKVKKSHSYGRFHRMAPADCVAYRECY